MWIMATIAAAARRPMLTRASLTMQVGMTGGDLEGGRDDSRNADVTALKKLFYREDDDVEASERAMVRAAVFAHVGLHADIPLARFRMVLMPHQQAAFNIFQPSLVHLFESLLATPRPWLFATAQLPGGVENLANPEYALPGLGGESGDEEAPGSSATLHGTLSEVVTAHRMADARLYLVVHCLRRAVVVRGTQALPFTRADVLCLPDAEQLGAATRVVARRAVPSDAESGAESGDAADGLRQSAILAAAAAEDRCWQPYEFAAVQGRGREFAPGAAAVPTFASFAPGAAAECARCATEAVAGGRQAAEALAETEAAGAEALAAMAEAARAAEAAAAAGAADAALEAVGAFGCCEPAQAALQLAEVEAVAGAEEGEAAAALATLERQVWVELDAFFRALAARNAGAMPAPVQLLSLLPPPPLGGWPGAFQLDRVAAMLAEDGDADDPSQADDLEPFVPCDPGRYSARRRAQRLSYSIWLLIRQENADLQPALEVSSTCGRLRLALDRLRELRESV